MQENRLIILIFLLNSMNRNLDSKFSKTNPELQIVCYLKVFRSKVI